MADLYNDNSIQHGSKQETIKRGATRAAATTVMTTVCENISINREVQKIQRFDEVGQPNGFVLVRGPVTGSCTIQIGASGSDRPHNGDWFEDTFDTDVGVERFVFGPITDPYGQLEYYKQNVTFTKAEFPT